VALRSTQKESRKELSVVFFDRRKLSWEEQEPEAEEDIVPGEVTAQGVSVAVTAWAAVAVVPVVAVSVVEVAREADLAEVPEAPVSVAEAREVRFSEAAGDVVRFGAALSGGEARGAEASDTGAEAALQVSFLP
jgi:hypothetical protein